MNYSVKQMTIQTLIKSISKYWKVWGGVIIACLLAGCKSSTGLTSSATSSTAIMKTEEAFFSSMLEHTFRYDTFSARLNLEFSGIQQELSSRVQMKMIHDDRMQFSVQPFPGFEVVRVEISNDSIKMLDRINRRFVADSYQRLKREMEIDFNFQNLQALFTSQLFVPGENAITTRHFRHFRVTKNDRSAEFQLRDRSEAIYTFIADVDEKLLATKIENENQQLTWNYIQFQTVDGQLFPVKMTASLSSGDQMLGTATLTFSTPDINRTVSMDFNIPSGYKRVTLEQMIKSIVK